MKKKMHAKECTKKKMNTKIFMKLTIIPILSLKKNHSYYYASVTFSYLVDQLPKFEDLSEFDDLDEAD